MVIIFFKNFIIVTYNYLYRANRYYKSPQPCGSPLLDPEADCQTAWAYAPGIANYRFPSNLGYRYIYLPTPENTLTKIKKLESMKM